MLGRSANAPFARGSRQIPETSYTDHAVLRALGPMLHREFLRVSGVDPLFVESIGHEISGHIVRQVSRRPGQHSLRGRLNAAQLRQTIELIEEGLTTPLRVTELAARVGMNPRLFTRHFTEAMVQTPYQLVLRGKIERAKTFLTKTDMTIAQIAHSSCFPRWILLRDFFT